MRKKYRCKFGNKSQKRLYGVGPKPIFRNLVDNDEDYDYDAVFIP